VLEDRRLLAGLPAAANLITQTLTNPTVDGTGATLQYLPAGNYQTVANEAVTVGAGQTGLFQLTFQAQAWSGVSTRVGIRYLIDGQFDPGDAVIRSGTAADVIEDVGSSGWQSLYLTRLVTLSAGTHLVEVQIYSTAQGFTPSQSCAIYAPVLSLLAFNTVDGFPTADGIQVQSLTSPLGGSSNRQAVTVGTWQTVTSANLTVGPSKTGLYDLTFEAIGNVAASTRVTVRYLIDGKVDPRDLSLTSTGPGADVTEDFADAFGGGQWHTVVLSRQLALGIGTHTIAIQVMDSALTSTPAQLAIYTPVLTLIGYNTVDAQHSADGLQTLAVATPVAGAAGQQNVTAGGWQTVASLSVPVAGIRSGLFMLGFQAQAQSSSANRVYVRYLIDGKVDPNDVGIQQSASESDAVEDFFDAGGGDAWHMLSLIRPLAMGPGTHTVSVQVWCTQVGVDAPDLVIHTPALHVTGINNITPTSGTGGTGGTGGGGGGTTGGPTFSYNPTTQVLTINGKASNNQFKFVQSTHAAADGTLTTKYTFTLNGATVSYTSAQLSRVIVNGVGISNTATLYTNDTYIGADGVRHETQEQANLGPGGGILQKFDALGNPFTFLRLAHFTSIYAYMGHADSATYTDSVGNDTFVSAGLSSHMNGNGFYNYVTGAGSVAAMSTNGGHDVAYLYDGSGASTFTATGTISSTMTGTDGGASFTNTALGFMTNYGIARHGGDIANLYDSPGNDVFVGMATLSYMYHYTGRIQTMYNAASGFSHVNAFSTAGGTDSSFNYAPSKNTVTGFKRIVG
jgi:hypothetical protein